MALVFPNTRKEIDNRIKTDIQTELQEANPFLANSFLSALASGNAGRFFEIYIQIQAAINECFPQTADGEFLEMWGALRGLARNPATQSEGNLTTTGVDGSIVPLGSTLASNSNVEVVTTAAATITDQALLVSSLTRSGSIVTAITTADDHQLATGVSVLVAGANQIDYNGTFIITVTGTNTFTYEITTTPLSPATGNITANATFASVPIESVDFGDITNADAGTIFAYSTPIAGVDVNAVVQFDGLTGGSDIETDEELRERILDAYQNPNTPFNAAEIIRLAKTVTGVTRVFVREPDRSSVDPELGQVVIHFMRDNDADPIPSAGEIATVKELILTIKPAHTADIDVIVRAPVPKTIDFQFISLTPNTATMKNAITNSLEAFILDETTLGETIAENAYNCAIFNTTDPETGQIVKDFQLISPIGDIVLTPNEIAVLGQVIF